MGVCWSFTEHNKRKNDRDGLTRVLKIVEIFFIGQKETELTTTLSPFEGIGKSEA